MHIEVTALLKHIDGQLKIMIVCCMGVWGHLPDNALWWHMLNASSNLIVLICMYKYADIISKSLYSK